MKLRRAVLGTLLVLGVLAGACSKSNPAETATTSTPQTNAPAQAVAPPAPVQPPAPAVPHYFESAAAAKPFPPLIPARFYRSNPIAERAYATAARYPGLVAQQPCYCHCDRIGHRSLLDCYSAEHAAG